MVTSTAQRTAGAPGVTAAHGTGRVVALGHDFEVRTDLEPLTAYLTRLFAPLARPGPARSRYTLAAAPRGCGLWFDGEPIVVEGDRAHALAMLLWHVNREVVARSGHLVLLHAAGATAREGDGIVMPAAMESGKSTLVAALVRAGFGYLSDEVVAVDPATLDLIAYPKALSLDAGSWPLLPELAPSVDPAVRPHLPHQWQVPADDIRAGATVTRAAPALIVAPRYRPGATARIDRLRPADALMLLASCAFGLPDSAERDLRVLGRLAERCACYELTMGDLDDACALVSSLAG